MNCIWTQVLWMNYLKNYITDLPNHCLLPLHLKRTLRVGEFHTFWYVVKHWFKYWINACFIVKVKTSEQPLLRSPEVIEVLYILLLIHIFQICQNDIWVSMWINDVDFPQSNWMSTRSLVCLNSEWGIDKGLVQSQASSASILRNFCWI